MKIKLTFALSTVVLVSLLSMSASAQDIRVGMGVSVDPFMSVDDLGILGGTDLRLPIGYGENIFIEPYFGITMVTTKTETDTGDIDVIVTDTTSSIRLGAGLHYRFPFTDKTRAYVGPRIGAVLNSTTEDRVVDRLDAIGESSSTDINVGLGIGGEHFFDQRFSLGAEILFNYTILGDWTHSVSGDENIVTGYDEDNDIIEGGSMIYTRGMVIVRWYFMGQ